MASGFTDSSGHSVYGWFSVGRLQGYFYPLGYYFLELGSSYVMTWQIITGGLFFP